MNTYKILPSLSINVTSNCNFNCIYCPPFGENFINCSNLCNINSIVNLIKLCETYKLPVVRITGGEPLLQPERVIKILETCKNYYSGKVILNTNGSLLDRYLDTLEKYKNNFLLKISLDTLDEKHFKDMTKKEFCKKVYNNLISAANKGFNIEINSVITKINKHDIMALIDLAKSIKVNIKLFGVNDFEGLVNATDFEINLSEISKKISTEYIPCPRESLPGKRGIPMEKFILNNGHYIWIVNHQHTDLNSLLYSQKCIECPYYPCITGRFSITLRSDGLLQGCRMRPEDGIQISDLDIEELEYAFSKVLNEYSNCYRIQKSIN